MDLSAEYARCDCLSETSFTAPQVPTFNQHVTVSFPSLGGRESKLNVTTVKRTCIVAPVGTILLNKISEHRCVILPKVLNLIYMSGAAGYVC